MNKPESRGVDMKVMVLAMLFFVFLSFAWAGVVLGDWHGMLDIEGMKLRIVFHISASQDSLTATFDSPDQGAFGLPVSSANFADSRLTLTSDSPPMVYVGTVDADSLKGILYQSGLELLLNLGRVQMGKPIYFRPQEPVAPFPYIVEELEFENPISGISLSATLTLPKGPGKYPGVVLISGSGPQDRNGELVGHKPFWVIADYLTRVGIAVLRYDDRGYKASQGNFATATTQDFASDAASAVKYLKNRPEISNIGLIGHSEGGLIAPMVAVGMPELIDFIIMLAGPGLRGDKLLLLQEELIRRVHEKEEARIQRTLDINRNIFGLILQENDPEVLSSQIRNFLDKSIVEGLIDIPEGYSKEDIISQYIDQMMSPWMLSFLRHDPSPILEKVSCPVLSMIGSNDLQVPARANLDAIDTALKSGGNKHFRVLELPKLNHLFQEAETGHPDEYAKIEQSFAPQVLQIITEWIREQLATK